MQVKGIFEKLKALVPDHPVEKLQSSVKQIVESFQPINNFPAIKPPETTQQPYSHSPHKTRKRTSYKANRAASLSLAETPREYTYEKKVFIAKQKQENPISFITNFFVKPVPLKSFEKLVKVPLPPNKDSVHERMHALEEEIQKFPKQGLTDADKEKIEKLLLEKVELVKEETKEHAARRIDLFFYTLIAVYGKNIHVNKDHTVKQNGKGSKGSGTQACHSSLFPNLIFTKRCQHHYRHRKHSSNIQKLLPSELLKKQFPLNLKFQQEDKQHIDIPSLVGTQFLESLNMTVELPNTVNILDGYLEGKLTKPSDTVKVALKLLNQVSRKKMAPYEAMGEFYASLTTFFEGFKKRYYDEHKVPVPASLQKALEYERLGSFIGATQDNTAMSEAYLHSLLRLDEFGIAKLKFQPALIEDFYLQLQKEIYDSPSMINGHTKKKHSSKFSSKKRI